MRELAREPGTRIARADDQRSQPVLAVPLTLEREQSCLESETAASQQHQQRRDRRRAQQRESRSAKVRVPGELEDRDQQTAGDRADDAQRLLDGGIAPHRPVKADEVVEEQLRRDRNQQVRDQATRSERHRTVEPRDVREEPRRRDDADIQDAQACVTAPTRDVVDASCETIRRPRRPHVVSPRPFSGSWHSNRSAQTSGNLNFHLFAKIWSVPWIFPSVPEISSTLSTSTTPSLRYRANCPLNKGCPARFCYF